MIALPEQIINKHFSHLHPNQMNWEKLMKNVDYAIGWNQGYSFPNEPNPFTEDTLSWVAWFEGFNDKRADEEFCSKLEC